MEAKLNIANILKDKPSGTKLYANTFGELSFEAVSTSMISTRTKAGKLYTFYNNGKYDKNGEPILVPSKEMRDWEKFTWKKGDVLVSNDYGTEVIFYDWYDDTYTNFYGKHRLNSEDKNNIRYNDAFLCTTGRYSLEDKDAAQTYIKDIEERLGGKLNRETIEVEKTQPEFKDGDIVAVDLNRKNIRIFKEKKNENNICWGKYYIGFSFNNEGKRIQTFENYTADCSSDRLATDSEKQQLFSALENEGKAWDANKKQIVDLKPKWTPKPFDKIVAFEELSEEWVCDMFSHYSKNYEDKEIIVGIGGCTYFKALPFNGETAKLIGTTNNWRG